MLVTCCYITRFQEIQGERGSRHTHSPTLLMRLETWHIFPDDWAELFEIAYFLYSTLPLPFLDVSLMVNMCVGLCVCMCKERIL